MTGPFRTRADAGRLLAPAVQRWCDDHGMSAPVVLGIPRGGVVVAAPVAAALDAPLGVVVVRKLGAPGRPEFAVGAIAEGVRVDGGLADDDAALAAVESAERGELARRTRVYAGGAEVAQGADVVVIDDGIATGSTAVAAVRSLRPRAGRILLAVPVAPASWHPPAEADGFVCLRPIADFWAVGQHYRDFAQTADGEVIELLAAARDR